MFASLALLGASSAAKGGLDWVKGQIDNSAYADRIRDQAGLQYAFAERYAKNSPSWNIEGLRRAGLNPVLAVSNGVNLGANVPNMSASSPDTNSGNAPDLSGAYQTAQRLDIERENASASMLQAKASASRSDADIDLAKANTAVKLLEAQKIKQELKGGGYKNPIVNDVVRGMNATADALNNSPNTRDSYSSYIKSAPSSSSYSKDTLFGSVQASIDANKEVSRITGKSVYDVSKMSDAEKIKILKNAEKAKYKSKGYHIFTR